MPGLIYSMKGAKMTDNSLGFDIKVDGKVSYLEIPLNVCYSFGSCKDGGLFVFGGPYLGYALSGKQKISYLAFDTTTTVKFGNDSTSDMKRMDFGLNLGVGYQLPMGLFFRAQYGLGLSNIDAVGDKDNFTKNKVFGISVGYYFRR